MYGHWLDADWTRQSALLYTSHLPARQHDHTRLPQDHTRLPQDHTQLPQDHTQLLHDHTRLLHDALDCWALTADMVCTVYGYY